VGTVITPNKADYSSIKAGQEVITDGPVVGAGNGNGKSKADSGNGSDPGYEQAPVDAYDDPFA